MKNLPTVYPPGYQLPIEPFDHEQHSEALKTMAVSDDDLVKFVELYFESFRKTVEEFFPQIASALTLYAAAPFHTTIVRLGPNGVIVGHRRAEQQKIEVKKFQDFDPPFESPNVLEIIERLKLENCWFDFTQNPYDAEEAHVRAVRDALSGVLKFFWRSIPNGEVFESICLQLIEAEGIHLGATPLDDAKKEPEVGVDSTAKVILHEPAGFRRLETWWFQFKHYQTDRLSAASLREVEASLPNDSPPHVCCLVTSDNLTSVSTYIASENPRIRVWDRSILDILANRHLDVLRTYFNAYPKAVEELTQRLKASQERAKQVRTKEFADKLAECPSGKKHFSSFEDIGIEILQFLFSEHLGEPKPQDRTLDGKQRRDVVFRNNRSSRLFDRLFHRFDSDFLIVDFKNYGEPLEPSVISDVDKYANKALGRFILVICRKGQAETVEATQVRTFRDANTVVLVVSDHDLLEMTQRKERGQNPEDVLEDKLDELLRKY